MVNPPFACLGRNNNTTEPGASTGARQGFNTRFDIYQGPVDQGNAEWQPAVNTIKGQVLRNGGCGDSSWQSPTNEYTGPGSIPMPPLPETAMPFPMDNCAYPTPGGLCDGEAGNRRLGLDNGWSPPYWDIETYLAVNHPTLGGEAGLRADLSFVGSSGIAAGQPITRYDVYKWELGYPGTPGLLGGSPNLPDNIGALNPPLPADPASLGTPQTTEFGGPQCYDGTFGGLTPDMDRRVIELMMVNCDPGTLGGHDIQGRTSGVDGTGFMAVFLLTPWKDNGPDHEMYVEVIGPVNKDAIDVVPAKNILQLYE